MEIIESPKSLAALCRELRESEGLTQKELADAIGERTAQAVSNAERAEDGRRFGVQKRILEHFGKHVDVVYRVEG